MLRIRAIKAEYGDSCLITYSEKEEPARHLLIDGGPPAALNTLIRVLDKTREGRASLRLEAVLITHYDLDHIGAIIKLLEQQPEWLEIGDVWFNHPRREAPDMLGTAQGDELYRLVKDRSWNTSFGKKAICAGATAPLKGGLVVTALSPNRETLRELFRKWSIKEDTRSPPDTLGSDYATLANTNFKADQSLSNRSSIAVVLEIADARVLFAADAGSDTVLSALRRTGKTNVDILKLSHHGSKGNTSVQLLSDIRCKRFLISTNGNGGKHPSPETIARIVSTCHANGDVPEVIFNYREVGELWNCQRSSWPPFVATFPPVGHDYIEIESQCHYGP